MNVTFLPNFNLPITLLGGQSFGWDYEDGWFYGFTLSHAVKLKREGDNLIWQTYPNHDDFDWLSRYLRLDVNYEGIIKEISKDQHINDAILRYPGLRLLKQDFDETLIGFLCSPTKSIVGIRQCIRLMAQKYGDEISVDDRKIHLFASPERIAEGSVEQLLECKVGFRARNIHEASKKIVKSNFSNEIQMVDSTKAIKMLKELRGIGDKVADCIAVYGLSHDEITPFDVWGKRFMVKYYNFDEKMKYEEMRSWISEYFGKNTSWAGQFLFEYIRDTNEEIEIET